MSSISPTPRQFKQLFKLEKDRPVTMLNLLKFKEQVDGGSETGEAAYNRYSRNVMRLVEQVGGRLVWMGSAEQIVIGDPEQDWDRVLIVEYPNYRAFMKMNTHPDYEGIHKDREAGLERTILIATHQLDPESLPAD